MPALMTYDQAQTWLAGRTTVPTVLGARELALSPDFPAGAKAQAFFSAKVSESTILENLRAKVASFATGETDLATARMQLKTFLASQGFPLDDVGWTKAPPFGVTAEEWAAHRQVGNLGSTARLDLILQQNSAMAHAIGQRQVSMDPDIMERWPNFRYIAQTDGRERPEHGALNGLSLPKTDPFWTTHTPPWDYACRCQIEDDEGAGQTGTVVGGRVLNPVTGQTVDLAQPEDAFVFDIESAMSARPEDYDWSAITDATLRETFQQQFPGANA